MALRVLSSSRRRLTAEQLAEAARRRAAGQTWQKIGRDFRMQDCALSRKVRRAIAAAQTQPLAQPAN